MRRTRRRLSTGGLLFAAVLAVAGYVFRDANVAPPRAVDGQVVAVIDGDTVGVMMEGREVRVRLYGIDAPEKEQPFGARAKRELSERIFGQVVTVQSSGHDQYKRTIARLYLDGEDVVLEMVRDGFAWWYRDYAKQDMELNEAENDARANRRGLWRDSDPVPPWEWRKQKSGKAAVE